MSLPSDPPPAVSDVDSRATQRHPKPISEHLTARIPSAITRPYAAPRPITHGQMLGIAAAVLDRVRRVSEEDLQAMAMRIILEDADLVPPMPDEPTQQMAAVVDTIDEPTPWPDTVVVDVDLP